MSQSGQKRSQAVWSKFFWSMINFLVPTLFPEWVELQLYEWPTYLFAFLIVLFSIFSFEQHGPCKISWLRAYVEDPEPGRPTDALILKTRERKNLNLFFVLKSINFCMLGTLSIVILLYANKKGWLNDLSASGLRNGSCFRAKLFYLRIWIIL